MFVIRAPKNKDYPFTQVSNSFLNNNRLSLRSKALLIFLLSKPDSWCFNYIDILRSTKDGIKSIRSSIRELISAGYLFPHQSRKSNGRFNYFNYTLYEIPIKLSSTKTTHPPHRPLRHAAAPHAAAPHAVKRLSANLKDKIILREETTTTPNVVNTTKPAVVDLNLNNKKTEAILLLNELKIRNHKKLFALFTIPDILSTAEWIKENHCKMKNPTGFFIHAVKENWKDSTISDSCISHISYFYYKCLKCGNVNGYINKIRNFDFCNKCMEK